MGSSCSSSGTIAEFHGTNVLIVGQSGTGKSALTRQLWILKGSDPNGNLRTEKELYGELEQYCKDILCMIPLEFRVRQGTATHAAVMQAIADSEDPRTAVGLLQELQRNISDYPAPWGVPSRFGLHLPMMRYLWNIPRVREILTLAHESSESDVDASANEWRTDLKTLFRIWERTGTNRDKFTLQDFVSCQSRSQGLNHRHICYDDVVYSLIDFGAVINERLKLPIFVKESSVVVFTVNLSNYNLNMCTTYFSSVRGTRHTDSINYFRDVLAGDLESGTVFVVVFTKYDMLEDKLPFVPFKRYHPSYTGDPLNAELVALHIIEAYRRIAEEFAKKHLAHGVDVMLSFREPTSICNHLDEVEATFESFTGVSVGSDIVGLIHSFADKNDFVLSPLEKDQVLQLFKRIHREQTRKSAARSSTSCEPAACCVQ